MSVLCPRCGAPINEAVGKCEYCGEVVAQPAAQPQQPTYTQPQQVTYAQPQQVTYAQPQPVNYEQYNNTDLDRASLPYKNKVIAAILAIFLGALGIHKFYLGQTGKGILCVLFCWTYIPGICGVIEGIGILTSSDEHFETKYKCRKA